LIFIWKKLLINYQIYELKGVFHVFEFRNFLAFHVFEFRNFLAAQECYKVVFDYNKLLILDMYFGW